MGAVLDGEVPTAIVSVVSKLDCLWTKTVFFHQKAYHYSCMVPNILFWCLLYILYMLHSNLLQYNPFSEFVYTVLISEFHPAS